MVKHRRPWRSRTPLIIQLLCRHSVWCGYCRLSEEEHLTVPPEAPPADEMPRIPKQMTGYVFAVAVERSLLTTASSREEPLPTDTRQGMITLTCEESAVDTGSQWRGWVRSGVPGFTWMSFQPPEASLTAGWKAGTRHPSAPHQPFNDSLRADAAAFSAPFSTRFFGARASPTQQQLSNGDPAARQKSASPCQLRGGNLAGTG